MGSPKELALGLLELLEACRSVWECMKLLEATQKGIVQCVYCSQGSFCGECISKVWAIIYHFVAFLRLTSANALGSSLYSASKIIHRRYHLLTILPGDNTSDVLLGSHGDHQSNAATACPETEDHDGTYSHDDMIAMLEQLVQFVRPFVSQIHHGRGNLDHMIHLTPVQHGCVSL